MNIADQLGVINARIAELQADSKKLKAEIIAGGHMVEGDLFRATPIHADRTTTAWRKVAEKLHASRQIITAYSKTTGVDSVKITARLASVA